MSDRPLINAWTEWGTLRHVVVGRVEHSAYPEYDPGGLFNFIRDPRLATYCSIQGPRPAHRITQAREELDFLCEVLEGECVCVERDVTTKHDEDTQSTLSRRCSRRWEEEEVEAVVEDERVCRIRKDTMRVERPSEQRFDHLVQTPFFRNYYQFSMACPRDMMITLGHTVVESATPSRARYFESAYMRELVYPLWSVDRRIRWVNAPKPTCEDAMFNDLHLWKKTDEEIFQHLEDCYKSAVNETQIVFEAADMMRFGKDVFYKKGPTANNKGIEWLRREFSDLRFHMVHFPEDYGPHLDVNLVPLRPPSAGSNGIVLVNRTYRPLESELKLFLDNDWDVYFCPLPCSELASPVAVCSSNLNMNLLSISEKCVIIEECETVLHDFLEQLGFDVITVPFRTLNEFGGGIHCCTWDIYREDDCTDFFPNQDYEAECAIDLDSFNDRKSVDASRFGFLEKVAL